MKTTIKLLMVLTVVLFSCRKTEETKVPSKITMTTVDTELSISIGGSGKVSIDFGDGYTDTMSFVKNKWIVIDHEYSTESLYTITITGEVAALACTNNKITTIDLSANPEIESLYCSNNQLTNLNISHLLMLGNLACNHNRLTSLDVSRQTKLLRLFCRNNFLTSLNLNGLAELDTVSCQFNYMNAAALNNLFTSLPLSDNERGMIYVSHNGPDYDGSGSRDCDETIAEKKGWKVTWE